MVPLDHLHSSHPFFFPFSGSCTLIHAHTEFVMCVRRATYGSGQLSGGQEDGAQMVHSLWFYVWALALCENRGVECYEEPAES